MATKLKRSVTCQSDALTLLGGSRTALWEVPEKGESVREIQITHKPGAFADQKGGPLATPYHWHWYQEEYFKINKGRFIFTYEGKEIIASPSSGIVTIPATTRHGFRPDPTCEEECEVVITATPEDSGLSERFFRNLYTYLDDCEQQGVKPHPAQLLLFLDSAEVSLAFPGPKWLMGWLSYALGVVGGRWLGQYVFGFKSTYAEYYDDKMTKRA